MFYKEINLSETFEHTGEQTVEILEKRAEEEKRKDLIVENPDPRFVYLHVIALGAGEYYGANSNGDYFPERELLGACENFNGKLRCYGFQTFETIAKVFKLHQNKDPNKAIGDVIRAIYNQRMHRVELIIAVDKEKAPDIVQRIENGEKLPVSMGCRVKYDKCSICDNIAYKSRMEYCEHGKTMLKQLLPDGRKVVRINYGPVFHDISFVRVPADKTAYVLAKVASEEGEKTAEIDKREPSMSPAEKIDAEAIVLKYADLLGVPREEVDVNLILKMVEEILKEKELLKEAEYITLTLPKKPVQILLAALVAKTIFDYFKHKYETYFTEKELLEAMRREGNFYYLSVPPWMMYGQPLIQGN